MIKQEVALFSGCIFVSVLCYQSYIFVHLMHVLLPIKYHSHSSFSD